MQQISWADNANPPVIDTLDEITSGPYKPGDRITFKLSVSGGSPGIREISISGNCLKGGDQGEGTIFWNEKSANYSQNFSSGFFSTTISGQCLSGLYSYSASVVDLTSLTTTKTSSEKYEVKNGYLLPNGEIRPIKMDHEINLLALPKIEFDPKKKISYVLPKFTSAGVPIYWSVANKKACDIAKDFPGDTGGTLNIIGQGICVLTRPLTNDSNNHRYNPPKVKSNWISASQTSQYLRMDIWTIGKPHFLLCVSKGGTLKRLTSPEATACPSGYSVKR